MYVFEERVEKFAPTVVTIFFQSKRRYVSGKRPRNTIPYRDAIATGGIISKYDSVPDPNDQGAFQIENIDGAKLAMNEAQNLPLVWDARIC
jgi:hypothetical protein